MAEPAQKLATDVIKLGIDDPSWPLRSPTNVAKAAELNQFGFDRVTAIITGREPLPDVGGGGHLVRTGRAGRGQARVASLLPPVDRSRGGRPPRDPLLIVAALLWVARTGPVCQRVLGGALDAALGDLLVARLTPQALQVTLAVQRELQARAAEADRLRRQRVERAQHEADLAQQRFLRVHPDNRLVADVLEAEWNARLRDLADARAVYERQRAADGGALDGPRQAELLALATDVPRLWRDPRTPAPCLQPSLSPPRQGDGS